MVQLIFIFFYFYSIDKLFTFSSNAIFLKPKRLCFSLCIFDRKYGNSGDDDDVDDDDDNDDDGEFSHVFSLLFVNST